MLLSLYPWPLYSQALLNLHCTVLSWPNLCWFHFLRQLTSSSKAPNKHVNFRSDVTCEAYRCCCCCVTHQNNEPHSIVHLLTLLSLHYGGASDRQHDRVYLAGLRCQRHSLDCGSQPDAAYKNQDKCALKQKLLT